MPENESAGRRDSLADGARQAIVVAGITSMVLGVLIAVWPQKSETIAELLFALYLLLSGAIQLVIAMLARFAAALRIFVFFSGVASVAMAVLSLNSANSVLLLAVWIGLGWAIRGIAQATVGAWDSELPEGGRHEVFGMLTMLAGLVMIALPFDSLDVLGVVAGVFVIVIGALELLTVVRPRGATATATAPEPTRVPVSPT
jgi:uncharacterized membrane protein HdeD (DUF308 family)